MSQHIYEGIEMGNDRKNPIEVSFQRYKTNGDGPQ